MLLKKNEQKMALYTPKPTNWTTSLNIENSGEKP